MSLTFLCQVVAKCSPLCVLLMYPIEFHRFWQLKGLCECIPQFNLPPIHTHRTLPVCAQSVFLCTRFGKNNFASILKPPAWYGSLAAAKGFALYVALIFPDPLCLVKTSVASFGKGLTRNSNSILHSYFQRTSTVIYWPLPEGEPGKNL